MSIVLLPDISGSVIWDVIQDRARRIFERLRPEDEIALIEDTTIVPLGLLNEWDGRVLTARRV